MTVPVTSELLEDVDSDKENVSPIIKATTKRNKHLTTDIKTTEKIQNPIMKKFLAINIQKTEKSHGEIKIDKMEEKVISKMEETKQETITEPNNKFKLTNKISNTIEESIGDIERSENTKRRRTNEKNNIDKLKTVESLNSSKRKSIPVLVKLENKENSPNTKSNESVLLKPNKIVWIPNLLQLPKGDSPKSTRIDKSYDESPPAGDEAEKRMNEQNDCSKKSDKTFDKSKEGASMEVPRKSIVDETKMKSKIQEEIVEYRRKTREIKTGPKNYKVDDSENEEDDDSNDEMDQEDNAKPKKFGKITDLITKEQKEAIEKYYTCDMSAVNEQMVGEKLVLLDKKKFGCKLCDASYTRQDKCQVHIWGHLEMKPYRCNACDFSTVTVSNIRCHVRKSHLKIKPFVCELCEKRYVTAFLLEEHMNSHTGSRPYGCDVCDFTSASRQVLSYHKTTHKPVKDITCHICGKEFYSKGRLRAHLIVHNKDKAANMCKLCSIYLCSSEALQRHYANVHNKDYECNVCGKRCKSKKALNNHQNVHSAAKYKCNLCSNVYKSSHILKEHLLKHKGIRKYKCNICQKDFAQQSHLAAHMAVHSDRRFFCPGCNRPFNRHDNMKMHTKRCEAFLANPELMNILSVRKSRDKNSIGSNVDKAVEMEKIISSNEPDYEKTDNDIKDERVIELSNVPKITEEYNENYTIIVESTIPCT